MNQLMQTNTMTSMEIAEAINKRHDQILRDIRDESEKLESAGIPTHHKFVARERAGLTGNIPYYELTKEGILQLAARYDAVIRSKLIDLAMQQSNPQPQSIEDLIIMQAQSVKELKSQVTQLQLTTSTIKETIITEPDNWREDINRMCNRIAKTIGENKFKDIRTESYKLLERRAGVNLTARLDNAKIRMLREGRTKTDIKKANKLDIVEADKKLREIYSKIIQEYTIKYCA
jgi:hypothetical protein